MQRFRDARANLGCAEVRGLLNELGFDVRDGSNGNHKTFTHDGIPSFPGSNYDCGHGKVVKPCYIGNIIRTLSHYEAEIREYLGE
jgi:hypothetical protein